MAADKTKKESQELAIARLKSAIEKHPGSTAAELARYCGRCPEWVHLKTRKDLKDFAIFHKQVGYQSRIYTVDYKLPEPATTLPTRRLPDCRVYTGLSLDLALKTPPGKLPESNLKKVISDVFIGGELRVKGKNKELPRECRSEYQGQFVSRRFLNDLKNVKEA
jgi:hypothetical protein